MSENERRGFLVLSILIVLMAVTPCIYSFYVSNTRDDIFLLSSLVEEERNMLEANEEGNRGPLTEAEKPPFPFNPNNLAAEKWKMLGFTEKQIKVIKNYEAKGGRFRTKADVAKIYVISEVDFRRIAPYITLPETVSTPPPKVASSPNGRTKPSNAKIVLDLSIADTTALKKIHGIGSVLAARIVKFRDALGGFHSIDQVKEVYGISEEQFVKMESSLTLGDNPISKWAINHLSVERLTQHPYISRKEATHIVRYREQHGAFASLDDLEKMYALNDDFLRKIAPYLEFN